ncbi:hypothetical protein R3P38DRAFT_3204596 [Favolaschia claudopus]|uniref:Uncharacterized protein n=1 Tax=Favolaschia claudopus TaxID=2862362 RepID=A0AAW0ATA5_9AGAR
MSTEIPPILATIRQVIHAANEADRAFDDEIEEDIEAEGEKHYWRKISMMSRNCESTFWMPPKVLRLKLTRNIGA